jgi:2-dehydro-3-deoxyphosphogluconate aldolase/(4S)-4-hydroxy-2-oxoglutarate aldolase
MSLPEAFQRLRQLRVTPVIAIESEDAALPLADALIEGGLPIAEITFRTAAAADVLRRLSSERPELTLGAGTVLTEQAAEAAKECGAQFAVAPGLNAAVVKRAQAVGLPFAPGVCTPSDVEAGLALGLEVLKFFPAGAMGGAAMLKALSGPYAHRGVQFIPTGGVNAGNLRDYLDLPVVAAVGGTWLAKRADIAAGRWSDIRERCREVVDIVGGMG